MLLPSRKQRPSLKTFLGILAICWVALIPALPSLAPAARLVRVGVYENPPLIVIGEHGVPAGFYIDILEHIAAEEGWRLEYVPGTWSRNMERLKEGSIDLLGAVAYTAERVVLFDFNRETVVPAWGQVYTRGGSAIQGLLDLEGRTMGVLKGDLYNRELRHLVREFGITVKFVEADSYQEVFELLHSRAVDAVAGGQLHGTGYASKYNAQKTLIVYSPVELRFAAPKGKSSAILAALDRNLIQLKQDKTSLYYEAVGHWLGGAERHWVAVWIKYILIGAAGLLVLFIVANLVLRRQVKVRTVELSAANRLLHDQIDRHHQAQQALAASEERLRGVFNSSAIGISVVDEQGCFVQVNPTFAAMLGYRPDVLVGMSHRDVTYHADQASSSQALADIKQGDAEQVRLEQRMVRKDGGVFWGDLTVTPMTWGEGESAVAMGALVDITERKVAEGMLRESEERLRGIFNTATLGIAMLGRDGKYVQVNPAWAAMVGYHPDELVGMHYSRVTEPRDLHLSERKWEATLAGEIDGYELQTRYVRKDDSRFWGEVTVTPIRLADGTHQALLAIFVDVTERRLAKEALERSEQRYRDLFDNIGDFIYTHDLGGHILTINQSACDSLGYPRDELVGRPISDFMMPEYRDGFLEEYLPEIQGGGSFSGLSVYLSRDGVKHFIEYRSSVVHTPGKEPFVSGSGRDVSERVMAERELRRLEEQLLQAQKMEAVGTLASGIAHDFNNILQAISGYVQLLDLKLRPGAPYSDYLGEIRDAVARASELVQRLLTFGRKMSPVLAAVDLNRVVADAIKMLERTIPKMIEIAFSPGADLAAVSADRNQLSQVLLNLGANAKDAMDQGGRLSITTSNVTLDEEYCRAQVDVQPGDYVLLRVADNGSGMENDTLAHAFEPFYTTKEVGEGTGLGLSTVYGIIKSHDGHLTCTSTPGQGTVFDIYLPARQGEAADQVEVAEHVLELAGGKETVLMADDEEAILEVGRQALGQGGYRVLQAHSGEEALDIYRRCSQEISLVLLDLGMPGMGGAKCLIELLKLNPEVKVIIASGYTQEIGLGSAKTQGAAAFLSKPYSLHDLLANVRRVIDA